MQGRYRVNTSGDVIARIRLLSCTARVSIFKEFRFLENDSD